MRLLSVREEPGWTGAAIGYLQKRWSGAAPPELDTWMVYDDCVRRSITAAGPLPHWYLLVEGAQIIGCAGLIPNDFISWCDAWPWLCAVYIEEAFRGRGLPGMLIERAVRDARRAGFDRLYLSTHHTGYYERYGFAHLGTGWHPWGESSRVYGLPLAEG